MCCLVCSRRAQKKRRTWLKAWGADVGGLSIWLAGCVPVSDSSTTSVCLCVDVCSLLLDLVMNNTGIPSTSKDLCPFWRDCRQVSRDGISLSAGSSKQQNGRKNRVSLFYSCALPVATAQQGAAVVGSGAEPYKTETDKQVRQCLAAFGNESDGLFQTALSLSLSHLSQCEIDQSRPAKANLHTKQQKETKYTDGISIA